LNFEFEKKKKKKKMSSGWKSAGTSLSADKKKKSFVLWANDQLERSGSALRLDAASLLQDKQRTCDALMALYKAVVASSDGASATAAAAATTSVEQKYDWLLGAMSARKMLHGVKSCAELLVPGQSGVMAEKNVSRSVVSLIWALIVRWHQHQAGGGDLDPQDGADSVEKALIKQALVAKQQLLQWCRADLSAYSSAGAADAIKVTNFRTSFVDGRACCALVHKRKPSAIDMGAALKMTPNAAWTLALDAAAEHLGVPKLFEPADVITRPDESSLFAYVGHFRCLSHRAGGAQAAPASALAAQSSDANQERSANDAAVDGDDGDKSGVSSARARVDALRARIRDRHRSSTGAAPADVAKAGALKKPTAAPPAPSASPSPPSASPALSLEERVAALEAEKEALATELAKTQRALRHADRVALKKSGVKRGDASDATLMAEIELQMLELLPAGVDANKLDDLLAQLRAVVAKAKNSDGGGASSSSKSKKRLPAGATSGGTKRAVSVDPASINLAAIQQDVQELEALHYLHHCSWREVTLQLI
jgi:Calponin homology (CH) domain